MISARQAVACAARSTETWLDELIWREF